MNAFEIERHRHRLAKLNSNNAFLKLYSNKFAEIKNLNLKITWDNLNSVKTDLKIDDPMAYERVNYVTRQILNGAKVLDMGFGSGNLEESLIRLNKKVDLTGIDFSPKSVASATKRFKDWVFKIGNVNTITLKSEVHDYVVALEVFEHISPKDVFDVYKKVHAALKKGGKFIISVPLNEGLEEMMASGKNPNAHVRMYTPVILRAELKVSGFEVESERLLYAFHSHYLVKSMVARLTLGIFKPNNIVIIAKKP